MDKPYIVGLYTAPQAGAPIQPCDWIDVQPESGVAGDRYALKLGYWSDPRWPDQEVTLVESEVAEALAIDPALLRRNIATIGVRLDDLIGVTFEIGVATLTGVRRCDPCLHLEELTRPGLMRKLGTRGGLRARVLVGGRIALGDSIRARAADQPAANTAAPNTTARFIR
ncbi:MAG TPA: MOSC domain-containing protein [Bryobacteraceae bacterium]|nr:MOSC domain-containing protein [Bryobacteraceae bacterium]